jgi:copper chaperone NosL
VTKLLKTSAILVVLFLAACSSEPETGPGEVRWDKEACARCIMAVSDHHFSAQVRGGEAGRKTKLHFFDDLGCAVLWLEEQPWREDSRTELWVTDYKSGAWLNAFTASYVTGNITPMDYGLGAQTDAATGTLNYDQAVQEIHDRENRLH